MNERTLHAAVARYLDLALPPEAVWHHAPMEGKRGWQAQRDLKVMGAKKGWPDLHILYEGRSIFIELKAPGKYPTPEQRDMHQRLILAGAVVTVARSLEEVAGFLRPIVPLRVEVE